MAFPGHDPNWAGALDFVKARASDNARILAPDLFWQRLSKVYRYRNTYLQPEETYDWLILHKGDLGHLGPGFLRGLRATYHPAFANAVFVVFAIDPKQAKPPPSPDHVDSMWDAVARLGSRPDGPPPPDDHILPDSGVFQTFGSLDEPAFREAMNRFWAAGGYVYTTLRDKVYYGEIDAYIEDYLGSADDLQVLDLCCGTGRLANMLTGATRIIGMDVSDVAIVMARQAHAGDPRFSFQQMDAHKLAFADASFDLVLFVDSIEHVMRVEEVLDQAVRVLRPGGRLFVTVANRASVHEFMSKKLGHGEFLTNYQHIREFDLPEVTAMAVERGLTILRSGGIFLYPYWGVPGVDHVVRHLTDEDAETVELFRELGRRAGPEYAYSFVLLLEKPA